MAGAAQPSGARGVGGVDPRRHRRPCRRRPLTRRRGSPGHGGDRGRHGDRSACRTRREHDRGPDTVRRSRLGRAFGRSHARPSASVANGARPSASAANGARPSASVANGAGAGATRNIARDRAAVSRTGTARRDEPGRRPRLPVRRVGRDGYGRVGGRLPGGDDRATPGVGRRQRRARPAGHPRPRAAARHHRDSHVRVSRGGHRHAPRRVDRISVRRRTPAGGLLGRGRRRLLRQLEGAVSLLAFVPSFSRSSSPGLPRLPQPGLAGPATA